MQCIKYCCASVNFCLAGSIPTYMCFHLNIFYLYYTLQVMRCFLLKEITTENIRM